MFGPAPSAHMSLYRHVVRWIGNNLADLGAAHQAPAGLEVGGITAKEVVGSEAPKIAWPGYWPGPQLWHLIVRALRRIGLQALQCEIDVGRVETGDGDVEVMIQFHYGLELKGESVFVPMGQLRNAVVGQHEGATLTFAEMLKRYGGDGLESQALGRLKSAVTGNYGPLAVDQYGNVKAKLFDAPADQAELFSAVPPCVMGVGL